ncbi:MAG: arsenate reductase (glutaredoxin) [Gammaproteobacteria bacterium]|nr:arsenate reductase (glutaredoxin) [Gammaproteobacteria bacterium]NNL49401.1 arsenate reductase (glutaredoxin) [Woeseiaceae bacterium]
MAVTIYHNPRCSKSRKTLQIIRDAGVEPTIILYLEEAPGAAEILDLAAKLGVPLSNLLRRGEKVVREAKDLPALDNDVALAAWMEAHPITLQRPIVVDMASGKAVVGRPPENVADLLS